MTARKIFLDHARECEGCWVKMTASDEISTVEGLCSDGVILFTEAQMEAARGGQPRNPPPVATDSVPPNVDRIVNMHSVWAEMEKNDGGWKDLPAEGQHAVDKVASAMCAHVCTLNSMTWEETQLATKSMYRAQAIVGLTAIGIDPRRLPITVIIPSGNPSASPNVVSVVNRTSRDLVLMMINKTEETIHLLSFSTGLTAAVHKALLEDACLVLVESREEAEEIARSGWPKYELSVPTQRNLTSPVNDPPAN